MPAPASKMRMSAGMEPGKGSPGRRRETTSSSRGPSQNGFREPVAGSRTQATAPCKLKFFSKSLCDSSSAGICPEERTEHCGLRDNCSAEKFNHQHCD